MTAAPLPEFEDPPVSEVVLSVEFSPLEAWKAPYFGLYWSRINNRYPNTDVQPRLLSQIERFGEEFWQRPEVRVQLLDPTTDIARYWYMAEPAEWLIQIQRDRFVLNWRKVQGNEQYPRYNTEVRPRFEAEWKEFLDFLAQNNIASPDIRQCEVTYLNDALKGKEWNSFPEALELFSFWNKKFTDGFLPTPETFNITSSFLMPNEQGRFHVATQYMRREIDQQEVVQLRLTSRGKPTSSSSGDIVSWMDLGREWAVRGFADFTTSKAHTLWKRKK